MGNAVWAVTPDRKRAHKMLECNVPAEIGLERSKNLLNVPEFKDNRVVVYKLTK